ncbi:MAG: hypothetical protein SV775_13430, partial [Thermodesulfobacteriota bacterium]|nr:hypothetical protein [Thermodesulfobacteriota bacterium]
MRYCKRCVMPDTRPGIMFDSEGVCYPCRHYDTRNEIDWNQRWKELEELADKYRGCNGDYYDSIITVSAGKDSYYQTSIFKEKLNMNPLLVTANNFSWTQTGLHNWNNLLSEFGVDAHIMSLNPKVCKKMFRLALELYGSPTWYFDRAITAARSAPTGAGAEGGSDYRLASESEGDDTVKKDRSQYLRG